MKEIPEDKLNDFKTYISLNTWRNAKTYESFSPHEYILNFPCWKLKKDNKCNNDCEYCKKHRNEFEKWVLFIREYGERVLYGDTIFICLRCDNRHYWTCGDPLEATWVLNRAITDDSRYKVSMKWLDRE